MSAQGQRCWCVIPAAGTGSRMGAAVPKQYLQLAGKSLLEHAVEVLLSCDRIEAVCVALHANDAHGQALPVMSDPRVQLTTGAAQRSGSVLAGLQALSEVADDGDWVLVHDAARPCLRSADITKLINAVQAKGIGGILAQPVVDTVKQVDQSSLVQRTLDRSSLWRAQTPQMFRIGELRDALRNGKSRPTAITDEASAMELAGHSVQVVPCGAHNMKVTLPGDVELAAFYMSCGESHNAGDAAVGAETAGVDNPVSNT